MTLNEYQKKRDFRRTQEPTGKSVALRDGSRNKLSFVVQKHAATRLHYDLRLEVGGTLKSWAVPKGPCLDPKEKRLAVEVEDHPLEYASFEGTIPAGQYGGGDVIVWDRGEWTPAGDPAQAIASGKLDFELAGEKLAGRWTLIRTRGKASGDKSNWLLLKQSDHSSRPLRDYDVTLARPESVQTGRRLSASGKIEPGSQVQPARLRKSAKRFSATAFVPPQLATLVTEAPTGNEWLHEIKFDGYRIQCHLTEGVVRLMTRKELNWTDRYPSIARAAAKLPADSAILDGEICAILPDGVSSFQALQNAGKNGSDPQLVYYAFDLLQLDGVDLRAQSLVDRKERLRQLLQPAASSAIQFSDHFADDGPALLKEACRLGLEGIISKRRDRPYISGRTTDWLKSKCLFQEELVVGGFTLSSAIQRGFGALLVGYFEAGELRYAGRVGTGFSAQTLLELRSQLEKHRLTKSPFAAVPAKERGPQVRWVKPRLVAQIEFSGWTDSAVLRHPSFQALREDKEAAEVTRPASLSLQAEATRKVTKPTQSRTPERVQVHARLTHPERILWPDSKLTKLALAEYYSQIAGWILPHLVDRPLSMVRCPAGVAGKCFYQKHAGPGTPESLARVPIAESDGIEQYLAVTNLDGLLSLVQMSILEIHPWGSRRDRVDRPDRIIFDLDPDERVSWQNVIDAALQTRARLAQLGLTSFLKTTGGKGLHVVVPLAPRRHSWDEVKAFARRIADEMVAKSPALYVAVMSKAARKGKIFIDYLRNDHGSTAIAPYSTRARPGAPVSTPLAWDELSPRIRSDHFNVRNLPARLQSLAADPWAEIGKVRQTLPKRR